MSLECPQRAERQERPRGCTRQSQVLTWHDMKAGGMLHQKSGEGILGRRVSGTSVPSGRLRVKGSGPVAEIAHLNL